MHVCIVSVAQQRKRLVIKFRKACLLLFPAVLVYIDGSVADGVTFHKRVLNQLQLWIQFVISSLTMKTCVWTCRLIGVWKKLTKYSGGKGLVRFSKGWDSHRKATHRKALCTKCCKKNRTNSKYYKRNMVQYGFIVYSVYCSRNWVVNKTFFLFSKKKKLQLVHHTLK